MFGLSLLRGHDKNTYIRALAAALLNNNYVSFTDSSDLANLTIKDIKILKTVEDWNSSKLVTYLMLTFIIKRSDIYSGIFKGLKDLISPIV